jgi:hypothetical protein
MSYEYIFLSVTTKGNIAYLSDPRVEFGTLQSLHDGADAGPSSETTRSSRSSTDVSNGKLVNNKFTS